MTPTPTDTDLPPDLVERVRGLTADQRDRLRDLMDEEDGPPATDIDWGEIERRMEEHAADPSSALTREQSAALIRAEMRKLGLELP